MKSPVIVVRAGIQYKSVIYYPKLDEETIRKDDGGSIVFSMYGAGWVDGVFVSKPSDLFGFFKNNNKSYLSKVFQSQRGSLTLYIKDGDKYFVVPDPLSGSMLFYYKENENWFISSDLESLLLVLKESGIEPEKRFDYLTELISTGNGGFVPSSYEGVCVLDPFEYILITRDSVEILLSPEHDKLLSPVSDIEKKNLFHTVREEFVNNVRSVSQSSIKNKVAHLTGGFDSRLVLAALLSSGIDHDLFNVMCSGNEETNDKVIAKKLASHYDLIFTNSDGRNSANAFEPGKALFPSMGMVRANIPSRFLEDYVVMSGGYGGLLRSVYGSRASLSNNSIENVLTSLFGKRFSSNENSGIISKRFYDFYYAEFERYINKIKACGLPVNSILDYIFATKRNRYYIGSISALYSKYSPRVDPLYSVNALRLSLSLTEQERKSNVLGLNLLRSFDETMISLPFDVSKIDDFYRKNYNKVYEKDFIKRDLRVRNVERERDFSGVAPTKSQIELSKSMNSSLMQILYLDDVQYRARGILKKNRDLIEKNLNWKVVNRFYRGELKNRIHIRTAFSIYDSLNWYS
ncbi:hypothetical protein [Alcaligenes faecalis]|uniref:hypothetical protein n=1 Tax=Alcaligenes faecalis TaxID=511 RepID=UPI0006C45D84|nr:hypothetical protein [Alcaligenes faecalis]MCX5595074.1 hypothetical protein [Alcaligenes faecalis]QQC33723.1 hypothetical protein I6H81_06090 [Alcaligenes faecalis]CAJ0910236.1 putative Asparagine synthase [Alcaligenes faecalis subsp. faecalis]CUI73345.1 Uncharacterised protein [Alcaligenes faecalis]GAU73890.1 hypothetical protein AFA2_02228 [Alcaligenes faecalis subsp. faecalis NBRC 13111]